jgi:hypothetical protein
VFISIWGLIKSLSFFVAFLELPVINISSFPLAVAVAVSFVVFKLASVGHTIACKVLCSIAFPFIVFPLSPIAVTIREFNFTDTITYTTMVFPTFFLTVFSNYDTSTFWLVSIIQITYVSITTILYFSEPESPLDRVQFNREHPLIPFNISNFKVRICL